MSIEGHRRLVEVIPDPVQEWWDKWEIRGLIVLSLLSQIILTLLGNRTRYKPNIWTRPLLWSAYLLEDWVATIAMGVISSNLGDYYHKGKKSKNVDPQLLAFWAPFFLIHLGGPDTITAYSLEDNELWLRHLVGLLSQTTLTIYIIILSWKGNWLSHLTIPILIIGIIKYGERTWSLYCGSINHLRDSFIRSIYTSRKRGRLLDRKFSFEEPVKNQWTYLHAIYIFVSLFSDLVMRPHQFTRTSGINSNRSISSFLEEHNELQVMYEVFYTKAFANHGLLGFASRLTCSFTIIGVLLAYVNYSAKKEYLVVDHIFTYLLLFGELIAEIYAFLLVMFSRWILYYFTNTGVTSYKYEEVNVILGQTNFFNMICYKKISIKGNFFPVNKLGELTSVSHCPASQNLQMMILACLREKSCEGAESNPSGAPRYRNLLLKKNVPIFASELEFHRTIITWHIATCLFYYFDEELFSKLNTGKNCQEMSDYMFYLLVNKRQLLPVGAGMITLYDTIIEATEFFQRIKVSPQQKNSGEICRILLQQHVITTAGDDEASEMQSTSIFFHACAVANQLIAEENRQLTWKFLEELWVEIMSYASAQCRVDMHAHQLRRGPEFLSLVWLRQAHYGLLDQSQITLHQARAETLDP